jgi:hypothetical protein
MMIYYEVIINNYGVTLFDEQVFKEINKDYLKLLTDHNQLISRRVRDFVSTQLTIELTSDRSFNLRKLVIDNENSSIPFNGN